MPRIKIKKNPKNIKKNEIINITESNSNNIINYSEPQIKKTKKIKIKKIKKIKKIEKNIKNEKNIKIKKNEKIKNEKIKNEKIKNEKIKNGKIKVKKNGKNGKIEPLFWMLQNKKEFPNWINITFLKYRITDDIPKSEKGVFHPFPYQKFARDYMQESSPYRGLLLYHGLGSGKCLHPETNVEYYEDELKRELTIEEIWKLYSDQETSEFDGEGYWCKPLKSIYTKSLDKATGKLVQGKVINIYSQQIDEDLIKIELMNGEVINITQKHKLLTADKGWTNDLKVGKYIAIPKCTDDMSHVILHDMKRREINFVKIVKIEKYHYSEYVYDLEIETHHNYVANNIICHNTCTAITIAENMKDRNKIVILPASLKANFIGKPGKEGLKFCGDVKYKSSNELIKDRYTFISSNASNSLQQLIKLGSLDNTVIIVDEVHNLISMMISTSKQGKEFYKRLMEARNIKLIFLSGTPIINVAFEAAIMLNVLRGYIEMAIFEIRGITHDGYGDGGNLKPLTEKLENIEYVDYVNHNIQGKLLEIHLRIKSWDKKFTETINKIKDVSEENGIRLYYNKVENYTLYPDDEEEFYKYFMDSRNLQDEKIKNRDLFLRRMMGLVSYYRGAKPEFYPRLNPIRYVRVPMSNYQFNIYEQIRAVEKAQERGKSKTRGFSKMGTSSQSSVKSTFRVFSREFSNFVFPKDIERPFPTINYLKSSSKKNKNVSDKDANEELNAQNETKYKKEISRRYQQKIVNALDSLWKGRSEYLSKKGLMIYSPKMLTVLELLKRGKGLQMIYSDFRNLEGIQIMSMVLSNNGYVSYNKDYKYKNTKNTKNNKPKFAIYSGAESHESRSELLNVFNSNDNKNGEIIKVLFISSAGVEGINLKNVREVYILDPYFHDTRTLQIIGRANRVMSHIELPEKDRDVTVYRFFSVFTKKQLADTNDQITTDEYLLNLSIRKKKITDDILNMMKQSAVDCTLNSVDNEEIKCLSYGRDAKGLAYLPKLSKDVVYSKLNKETKVVKKSISIGAISQDKKLYYVKGKKLYEITKDLKQKEIKTKPKLKLKVGFDLKSGDIFDLTSVQQGKTVLIGKISKKTGKVVRS